MNEDYTFIYVRYNSLLLLCPIITMYIYSPYIVIYTHFILELLKNGSKIESTITHL